MSTDLVEQVDPAQRLAACEAALLSMTEKRDAAEASVERLTAERDEARETNRSFHRRVQYAERFRLARKDLERIFWLLVRRHIKREVDADRRAKTAEASLAAERRRVEELETQDDGWIVGNGDATKWRVWGASGCDWTDDRSKATRYLRRQDAEAVHAADEDAWSVQRYGYPGRLVVDLSMLVAQLAKKLPEENPLRQKAIDYLNRQQLLGHGLRAARADSALAVKQEG